jgi:hypothetical protein
MHGAAAVRKHHGVSTPLSPKQNRSISCRSSYSAQHGGRAGSVPPRHQRLYDEGGLRGYAQPARAQQRVRLPELYQLAWYTNVGKTGQFCANRALGRWVRRNARMYACMKERERERERAAVGARPPS